MERDLLLGTLIREGKKMDFQLLSKKRGKMLDKESLSHQLNGPFTSASDSKSIKEESSLASDNTTQGLTSNNTGSNGNEFCGHDTILGDKTTIIDNNSFNYPLGDINPTSNDLDFFETVENNDSSDFLYYGWPEVGNFEDIERMFRSCDSTFGLGVCEEDELGWLSSADDVGGPEDVLKSDVRFPCPEPNVLEHISENHEFSKGYSINDSAMTSATISYKSGSWASENSDTNTSFVSGPAIADSKDETPQESINEHKKQIKALNQSDGKNEEHYIGNGSFNHNSDLPNGVMQLPCEIASNQDFLDVHRQPRAPCPDSYSYLQNSGSYVHPDNSHLSDPLPVNLKPSDVKSEITDLTSLLPRDSSHASSQLKYMQSPLDAPSEVTALGERKERLHCCQGSRSSASNSLQNGKMLFDPGLVGKYENHGDEGVSLATPAEIGSSHVQQSSTTTSGSVDISLEAASFHQLQHVMERLDFRTKLCIRDSLYRLARSAEQRHNHANLNVGSGDESHAGGGASLAEGTDRCTSFMDMETDTNPIDRSIAHLLFHRPSGSSTKPVDESFPLQSPSAIHGPVATPLILLENFVSEETVSQVEKVCDC